MYEVISEMGTPGTNSYVVRNTENGKKLQRHRFYDDAIAHLKRLESARIRRIRDRNVKQFA